MLFVRCLADFFELSVEFEGDGVLLRIPPTADENSVNDVAPNIIELGADGKVKRENYGLRDEEEDSVL
jgi:hypothetical protein